jgi:hypothetical protein
MGIAREVADASQREADLLARYSSATRGGKRGGRKAGLERSIAAETQRMIQAVSSMSCSQGTLNRDRRGHAEATGQVGSITTICAAP